MYAYLDPKPATPAQSLNPPLLGTLAGVTVGLSPVGSVLFAPASATARASAARLPLELLATLGALLTLSQNPYS